MEQISDLLTASVWEMLALGFLIFFGIVFFMRRRLAHIVEPALIQMFVLSFGFAGLYLFYDFNSYAWWAVVLGSILGLAPFVLLYRRSFTPDSTVLLKRAHLVETTEFRIFVVLSCCAIISGSLIPVLSSGLTVGPKLAPALLAREGGPLNYLTQAAVSFIPAFLLLTFRTRLFYLVVVAVLTNFLGATFGESRASFLLPALMIGAAFFLRRLDRNTAEGWPAKTIASFKQFFVGVAGIVGAFGLLWLAGYMLTASPAVFIFAFLLRLFESFDGLFMAIQFRLVAPHVTPEYSILLAYTQPIHKLLHLNLGQTYNNIGEYIAVHVYHFDIWSDRDLGLLALPNSNLVLEFELSYPLTTALILIPSYATAIVSLLNWSERRRYNSLGLFCLSQYLLFNPLQFFSDGNYFIVAAYGAALLFCIAKFSGVVVDILRSAYRSTYKLTGNNKNPDTTSI